MFTRSTQLGVLCLIIFSLGCKKAETSTDQEDYYQAKLVNLLKIDKSKIVRSQTKADLKFNSYREAYTYFLRQREDKPVVMVASFKIPIDRKSTSTQRSMDFGSAFVSYGAVFFNNNVQFQGGSLTVSSEVSPLVSYTYFPPVYSNYQAQNFYISNLGYTYTGLGFISMTSEQISNAKSTSMLQLTNTVEVLGFQWTTSTQFKAENEYWVYADVPSYYDPPEYITVSCTTSINIIF